MGDIYDCHGMIFSSSAHRPYLMPLCSSWVPLQNFITGTQSIISIAPLQLAEELSLFMYHTPLSYLSLSACHQVLLLLNRI